MLMVKCDCIICGKIIEYEELKFEKYDQNNIFPFVSILKYLPKDYALTFL
jgi:hypothetical protein